MITHHHHFVTQYIVHYLDYLASIKRKKNLPKIVEHDQHEVCSKVVEGTPKIVRALCQEVNLFVASQIKEWTNKDPILSRVRRLVQSEEIVIKPTADLFPYHQHQRNSVF